jgi:hypothetical protein
MEVLYANYASKRKKTRLCRPILVFQNPLSQVGVRRNGFEVPFRGHDSRASMLNSRETVIGSKQLGTETYIADLYFYYRR